MGNAFETAKSGGRHGGTYLRYKDARTPEVEKSIRSLEKQVNAHEQKIVNPTPHVKPDISADHLNDLVSRYWPREIDDLRAKIAIMKRIIDERDGG